MAELERILSEHPFFAGFSPEYSQLVAGCARNHRFEAEQYLFHEGEPANEFFLIRHGKVALEISAPGRTPDRLCDARGGRDRRRLLAGSALSVDV